MAEDDRSGLKGDLITVVEAAYDLELDARAWLTQLMERIAPRLDRGFGVSGWVADFRSGKILEETIAVYGMEDRVLSAVVAMVRATADLARQSHTAHAAPLCTGSQLVGLTDAQARTLSAYVDFLHPLGIRDGMCLTAVDPEGRFFLFAAPMANTARPSKAEVTTWSQVATHIAAGARLREGIARQPEGLPDAVVSPSGAIEHAEGPAKNPTAREHLRASARSIDRARTKARGRDAEALELWRGLVAGKWSLVDRFDSDGRRFLVARKNDPHVSDPRALTMRERQVLAYAAMGHPLKLIAYALGLSISTVAQHRERAMAKLGLKSQADLVRVVEGPAPRRRTHRAAHRRPDM